MKPKTARQVHRKAAEKALRLLDEGKTKLARQWLVWALGLIEVEPGTDKSYTWKSK